jgi:hypothetical protein
VASEGDPLLRRLERDAILACLAMALGAWLARPGEPGLAAGVLAGGMLAAVSYRGIKGGIDALLRVAAGERAEGARGAARAGVAWPLVKFFTRYAILALAAYVVLVHLGVHPVGVVLGASSLVAAAAVAAIRLARAPSRSGHPR